jgi:hypothetical protein
MKQEAPFHPTARVASLGVSENLSEVGARSAT